MNIEIVNKPSHSPKFRLIFRTTGLKHWSEPNTIQQARWIAENLSNLNLRVDIIDENLSAPNGYEQIIERFSPISENAAKELDWAYISGFTVDKP